MFDFGRDDRSPTCRRLPEPFNEAGYTTGIAASGTTMGGPRKHGYAATNRLFTGGGGKWWKPQIDYRGQDVTGYKGWIFRDADDNPLPELGVGLTPAISELIADAAVDVIQGSQRRSSSTSTSRRRTTRLLTAAGLRGTLRRRARSRCRETLCPITRSTMAIEGGRDEVLLPIPAPRRSSATTSQPTTP